MKTIGAEQTSLDTCIKAAQEERILITRAGEPVALIVGVEGMDQEQIELGSSSAFWELITERRKQKTLNRAALEDAVEALTQENENSTNSPA